MGMEIKTGAKFEASSDSIDADEKQDALSKAKETLNQQRTMYKAAVSSLLNTLKERSEAVYDNVRLHGKEVAKRNPNQAALVLFALYTLQNIVTGDFSPTGYDQIYDYMVNDWGGTALLIFLGFSNLAAPHIGDHVKKRSGQNKTVQYSEAVSDLEQKLWGEAYYSPKNMIKNIASATEPEKDAYTVLIKAYEFDPETFDRVADISGFGTAEGLLDQTEDSGITLKRSDIMDSINPGSFDGSITMQKYLRLLACEIRERLPETQQSLVKI